MRTVVVELGARSYPIHIGHALLGRGDLIASRLPGRQVLIVSNDTVAPLYLERMRDGLAGLETKTLLLPDGEQHKTLAVLGTIFDQLMAHRFARDCTVLALGGGVVGDIAGLAAACYQRGVGFVQLPTTLLAQVDSAVGGKTAVNHPLGKNMIGAFHQPLCVVSDTDTLQTLPPRELAAGLAEVIKYGLIRDAAFFNWLEANMDALLAKDREALAHAIEKSCAHKAALVGEDEREAGSRTLLNLGHTFGHAIEAGLGYGAWLHGEAVGTGMCMAADMSVRLGWLDASQAARIGRLIERAGLPVRAPSQVTPSAMLELMGVDKKVRGGRIRLVLLKALGKAVVSETFEQEALERTLATVREAA